MPGVLVPLCHLFIDGIPPLQIGQPVNPLPTTSSPPSPASSRGRCLWLARELPFPLDSGDRIYSAELAQSVARAGVDVTFVGHALSQNMQLPADPPISWRPVAGGRLSTAAALLSSHPLNAALHATPAYVAEVESLLAQPWDAIVFDHYGSSWIFQRLHKRLRALPSRPVLVHISHNHETRLWRSMVRDSTGSLLRKLGAWQNMLKIAQQEPRMVRGVDLLGCITEEDRQDFAQVAPETRALVLTPGYSGAVAPPRLITADCPRRVVMVGSFRWVVKQENLCALIEAADARFHAQGIALDVVGDVPEALRSRLEHQLKATRLHGFVDDIAPLMAQARLAIVPEVIGGGFKLKFLQYLFARVPVATLAEAAAGLPDAVRQHMIQCTDLPDLVQQVVDKMDDVPLLNALQSEAFEAAHTLFRWQDRGEALWQAVSGFRTHKRPALDSAEALASS
jgi:hypothetical protein